MHLVISKAINVTTLKNPAKKVIHSGRHWGVLNRHLDDHDARKELERLTIIVMAILRGVMANSAARTGPVSYGSQFSSNLEITRRANP